MIICMHYNDQVWDQDGWMLAEFLVCIFLDWDEAEFYNNKKNKMRLISSHVYQTSLFKKGFIMLRKYFALL